MAKKLDFKSLQMKIETFVTLFLVLIDKNFFETMLYLTSELLEKCDAQEMLSINYFLIFFVRKP